MPNLRSLRLNIDGKVPDFNLASLLRSNSALESLHIHLVGAGVTGGIHGANVHGSGTALRHELQDTLPMRLRRIVIEGQDIENFHPAAFKVCCWLFHNFKVAVFKTIFLSFFAAPAFEISTVELENSSIRRSHS
jgi:hypothetical protein